MSIVKSRLLRVRVVAAIAAVGGALLLVSRLHTTSRDAVSVPTPVTTTTPSPSPHLRAARAAAGAHAAGNASRGQLPPHLPDQRFGARTALASGFQRVSYSLADYAVAYPQYPLPPDVQELIKTRAGGAITEVQGAAGEPIVAFASLAVACPAAVGPIVYPLAVRVSAQGHVVDAITLPLGRPVPAQLAACTFTPDASTATRTTFLPTGTVIAAAGSL